MSSCSSSGSCCFLEDEELLQFEARCKELRIEKDMLKKSSVELIRSLESHAKILSESRSNDKKRIRDLERELSNCSQEIDYLQDQLNTKDSEINNMTDYIHNLESKLRAKEILDLIVRNLVENSALMERLEKKEHELHNSTEKLEELISNFALDFQCDIESMKLDLMAIEDEAQKIQEKAAQENHKIQIKNTENVARLIEENKELKEKLKTFKNNSDSENEMKKLSCQVHEYELVVNQLKEQLKDEKLNCWQEQLKDEKLKAKEEAEDLAQEMAELRYQLTGLLEEEYKKRAYIEQRALKRITELEAQIDKERRKTFADVRGLPNA